MLKKEPSSCSLIIVDCYQITAYCYLKFVAKVVKEI
jgi:hypothetical protein